MGLTSKFAGMMMHEDEAQRRADISEVAEKEAEAIPEWRPDPPGGHGE